MRCSVSFLVFVTVTLTANAQIENFAAQNQNFANQNQNFGSQNPNLGTTHFPLYHFEDNDLSEEQFFYFDIDLLKEIASDQPKENILISPLSIKSVLAMILEGARNESAAELRNALRLPDNKGVRNQFRKLLTKFENPKGGVNLQMANRIFISKNLTPLQEYTDILTKYYNSNVTRVDFSYPAQSAHTINSWVNEKTHGIIPVLVNEASFGGEVSILLANALYFKGQWEKAFSELGTKTNCFYLSKDNCQETPMMDVVDDFKYDDVKKLDAKVLELPYAGGEYSMVIILPNKRDGIEQLIWTIRNSIDSIVRNLNETEVFVTLPRFKIDYNTDLVDYIRKVRIQNIFGPNAKLTGIVADVIPLHVSNALHKTSIEVNEQGTIAAAATGAVVIPLMGTNKPRFKADHPFLFFIRHTATGTILFEGRLSKPEASPQQNQQQNHQQNQQQNHQQNQQPNYQQNQQQNHQQNQQQRPSQGNRQQPALQRPQAQAPFLSTPQNNFNQNFQPQRQAQPQAQAQPQHQNSFSTAQQNFNTQQPYYDNSQQASFQNEQSAVAVAFESQTPPNYQNRPLILPQLSLDMYQKNKEHVYNNFPMMLAAPIRRNGQPVQSDDANALRNNPDGIVYKD